MADHSNRTLARTDEDPLPERLVAEVVLNRRRRYALYYLSEHPNPVPVEDLAAQVAAWERATTAPDEDAPDKSISEHVELVATSLRENHLPHLDGLDLVAYDDRDDRVTGRIEDPTVELYLTNDPRTTVAWYRMYLVLTVVSTVVIGLTQVGIPPFDDLGPVGAAGVIVALFAAASLTYWYDVRRWRRRNRDEPPDFLVSLDEEIPFEERKENGNRETGRDDENGPKDGERR
jgi:hypothetical protein